MGWTSQTGRWIGSLAVALAVTLSGCMSDKSNNEKSPFESAHYQDMQDRLEDALAQFCASFNDALEASVKTDTAALPGLSWPFEMPALRRDGQTNFVDENTSWGVGYNRQIDTVRYAAFWDLGRLVDTGVIDHLSPIVATKIEHDIVYGRIDGFGDTQIEWSGSLHVSLANLDEETASLSGRLAATHRVGGRCGDLVCDSVRFVVSNGSFGKTAGSLNIATLDATIIGVIAYTEFDYILGYDAHYVWSVSGSITDGVATLNVTSGDFTASDSYPLCP